MFDVTFTSAVLLKKIFNALNDVLKEVSFECSDKAIEVKGMDASHVSLVQLYDSFSMLFETISFRA